MKHAVSRLACMHPVRTPLRSSAAQQASSRSAYGAESANHRRGKSQERYRSTQRSTPRQACTMIFQMLLLAEEAEVACMRVPVLRHHISPALQK